MAKLDDLMYTVGEMAGQVKALQPRMDAFETRVVQALDEIKTEQLRVKDDLVGKQDKQDKRLRKVETRQSWTSGVSFVVGAILSGALFKVTGH